MGFPPKTTMILITIFWLFIIAGSIPNTAVITALCNSGMYSQGDPFGISLDYVVAELERATPTSKSYDFFNVSPFPNAFAYGHATCNLNLTNSDCATCLGAAKTTMFGTCQSRIGARAVLQEYEMDVIVFFPSNRGLLHTKICSSVKIRTTSEESWFQSNSSILSKDVGANYCQVRQFSHCKVINFVAPTNDFHQVMPQ